MILKITNVATYMTSLYKVIIWSIAGIFVIVTGQVVPYNPQISMQLHDLFHGAVFHESFFSIFEILLIILCSGILSQFKASFRAGNKVSKFIFIISIIYYLLLIINPNNATRLKLLGLISISMPQYYVYFLLLYTFLFTDRRITRNIITEFLNALFYFAYALCIFSLANYFTGGIKFDWVGNSSMTQEDTLIHLVLIQGLATSFYLFNRKMKYLNLWILVALVEILSFRRSGFLLMLIINSVLIGGYYTYKTSILSKIKISLVLLYSVMLLFSIYSMGIGSSKIDFYSHRYFGAFLIDNEDLDSYAKNRHIEQANYGYKEVKKYIIFWGNGISNSGSMYQLNYEGNTGIHNAYVQVWLEYGFYAFLYHIILCIAALVLFFTTFVRYVRHKTPELHLNMAIAIFLAMFFINGWVLIMQNFIMTNMLFIRVILFSVLVNYRDEDYKFILQQIGNNLKVNT
jgi:hypothetical protein